MNNELKDRLRDEFLEKLQEIFPDIKDIFIEVYEKSIEEVNYYESQGFTIWETSTAPAGKKVLNVHMMQKTL